MNSSERSAKRARPLLGTRVSLLARGRFSAATLTRALDAGFAAVAEVDRLMSPKRPGSDLSRLNAATERDWVRVAKPTREVLRAANTLYKETGGLFDPRAGAQRSWGTPVALSRGRARRNGGPLDLGGIAKGYAVDRALAAMRRAAGPGLNAVAEAGGDLRVCGRPAKLALRFDTAGGPRQAAFVSGPTALATSAPGERTHWRMPAGRLLAPGATVSVFAPTCLVADALTKVVLSDRKKAAACLRRYRARAVVIDL